MTPWHLHSAYNFNPVGQGLFADGVLNVRDTPRRPFVWVYDCGTSSPQSFVTNSLDRFLSRVATDADVPVIDLLTISHFDHDHISGIVRLLSRTKVRTLLLPYIPLWQRLSLAFANGVDSQQWAMRLYVNPVRYLAGAPGASVEQIVLVPASTGAGPEGGDEGAQPAGDGPWELTFDTRQADTREEREDLEAFANALRSGNAPKGRRQPRIHLMPANGRLRLRGTWEFVPYNDALLMKKATATFRQAVEARSAALLGATSDRARTKALEGLKDKYDRCFGRSGLKRNVVSLFLYGGPLGGFGSIFGSWIVPVGRGQADRPIPVTTGTSSRVGILYTGDGYLDTKVRLTQLMGHLGSHRVRRVACLQVMHHGAEGNWHAGVAGALAPDVSVFSSDPGHKGLRHPHAPVVRDFLPYGPAQVDQSRAVVCNGVVGFA